MVMVTRSVPARWLRPGDVLARSEAVVVRADHMETVGRSGNRTVRVVVRFPYHGVDDRGSDRSTLQFREDDVVTIHR
jgi:hypothetical protein